MVMFLMVISPLLMWKTVWALLPLMERPVDCPSMSSFFVNWLVEDDGHASQLRGKGDVVMVGRFRPSE